MDRSELLILLENYDLPSKEIVAFDSFGEGLIHETFRVQLGTRDYLIQAFNTKVFSRPQIIAENLFLLQELKENSALTFQLPLPLKTNSGDMLVNIRNKNYRLFNFVEGTTLQQTNNHKIAFQAAIAYGKFSSWGDQLKINSLQESIPDFHRLDLRFKRFKEVLATTSELIPFEQEIVEFYLAQSGLIERYDKLRTLLPLRLTHNDTKLNNLIFHKDHNSVAAIVDLDTVMPGFLIYDFGDLVRTAACTEPENSKNWAAANLDLKLFKALLAGYLEGLSGNISKAETESLLLGGEVMTCIMGLRFLTDYLEGNKYYKVQYAEQNLHRAKNQANFLESQQSNRERLEIILKELTK